MAVLIFIMALLVIFPGIWQGHHGNNGPAILLELALLCDYSIISKKYKFPLRADYDSTDFHNQP